MTDIVPEEDLPPVAHVTVVYTGPVAPHWELTTHYGDQKMLDDFWGRVNARLLLLPKHDPQFRRNKERVNRDAERERIICDWDLGDGDAESTSTPVRSQEPQPTDESTQPVDDAGAVVAEATNPAPADTPDDAAGADQGAAETAQV